MKFLFSFYMPSGGMGTLNKIRTAALTKHGHDCRLLYTCVGEDVSVEALKRLFQKEEFDTVVVSSDYVFLQKIREAGYQGPLIYEVQGYGPPEEGKRVIVQADSYIREYADAVLYPRTSHLAKLFQSHLPELAQYSFDNPQDSLQMRYHQYPPRKFPVIGWVGRIEYNKNWAELLELIRRLIPDYPNLYVWMFGDQGLDNEWELQQFEAKVEAYGLTSRVIRYSNVPYALMADYFSIIGDSGGFLCSTSLLEGFGYAVGEAMLCRCPVLSSSSDGVTRMVKHKKTGMLYRSGDVDGAVEAAKRLMNDRLFRQRIRRAGALHIRKQFQPEQYAANFIGMVQKMTN